MKTLLLSVVAVGALASAALAQQVAVGPGSVKLGKIEPEGVKTPGVQIIGGPQKRSKTGTWLEIEVAFETKPDAIDELTFNYFILVDNTLLTGNVTHVNIPKGKDHYSVMYIAPRTLERLTGGKPLSSADIQNAWVQVSRQGQMLDQTSLKPGALPNLAQQPGMILNKGETPFAPLFYDRYEAIKGNAH